MILSHAKAIFIFLTLSASVALIALTYDSHMKFPALTHEEKLNGPVASGKWVWQKYNCNDCHTILGIGGYYAPDLTNVMERRDAGWISRFMQDPSAVWPAARVMPNLHLSGQEISDLTAFLTWVGGIDTNGWPPKPLVAAAASGNPGEAVYMSQGCSSCHKMNGVGGSVGPDLTHVGSRRDSEWIKAQIKDPKSHNPNSIMPSFARLPEKDLGELANYLAGLK